MIHIYHMDTTILILRFFYLFLQDSLVFFRYFYRHVKLGEKVDNSV